MLLFLMHIFMQRVFINYEISINYEIPFKIKTKGKSFFESEVVQIPILLCEYKVNEISDWS